ncbi:unnamed protein product, partial [Rotaria sp. Silwood2]
MPKKLAKYGIKFWLLSDVDTRYVLALELYTGKIGNVVLRLIDQLSSNIQQGCNVTYDRYFTDFNLAQALLERKMTSLGVVDHKRSFVPIELNVAQSDLGSSWFYFNGPN